MKKTKRIYLNKQKTKYCIVKVFKKQSDMRLAYMAFGHHVDSDDILGAHCGYKKLHIDKKKNETMSPETGTIFLHWDRCGAGVVCHEFAHAVLWANKHTRKKDQYPIVINNMGEEEVILHNLTMAIQQFYNWLYSVESYFKTKKR